MDTLKEFPDQPLTFEINNETLAIVINSENGKFTIMGQNGNDFPQKPEINDEEKTVVQMGWDVLLNGVSKSIFSYNFV